MRSFDLVSSDRYTIPIIHVHNKANDRSWANFIKIFLSIVRSVYTIFEQIEIIPREKYRGYHRIFHSNEIDERFDNWRGETASTDVIAHRVKIS